MSTRQKLRCAIYTRKSHEDGLEQEFNSLAAQREACLAYITSQKSEGWVANATCYDDGGFSGGTLERPALRRLLEDVDSGHVDVIVVYKVDRLTRSLTDFAKIVERLDARGASFVSVTQAFNTTSSMGRLTLNVLLSFAQFEREVTGERIRDKIAASKAKGMWMGGVVPLGYDIPPDGGPRMLIVNPIEAETVRQIFRRYLELGSVHDLRAELEREGVYSKRRKTSDGRVLGGQSFSRGALFHLLKNRVYLGVITHKGADHPGLHEGIVDAELFEAVQKSLADNARRRATGRTGQTGALLKGRIFDEANRPMSPTVAYGKSKRAYRYYVSNDAQRARPSGDAVDKVKRVSAARIEALVAGSLCRLLGLPIDTDWAQVERRLTRVTVARTSIKLCLASADDLNRDAIAARASGWCELDVEEGGLTATVAAQSVLRGGKSWLVGPDGGHALKAKRHDPKLIDALKSAHAWQAKLNASPLAAPETLAKAEVHPDSYVRRLSRIAFLAPDIQRAILEGQQPPGLTIKKLLGTNLPLDWSQQRRLLGFDLER